MELPTIPVHLCWHHWLTRKPRDPWGERKSGFYLSRGHRCTHKENWRVRTGELWRVRAVTNYQKATAPAEEPTIKGVRQNGEESLKIKREFRPQYMNESQPRQLACALSGKRLCVNQKRDLNKLWNTSAPRQSYWGSLESITQVEESYHSSDNADLSFHQVWEDLHLRRSGTRSSLELGSRHRRQQLGLITTSLKYLLGTSPWILGEPSDWTELNWALLCKKPVSD